MPRGTPGTQRWYLWCSHMKYPEASGTQRKGFLLLSPANMENISRQIEHNKHNTENFKQIFSEKELRDLSPYFCIPAFALQMKGRWESNINVWFPFMYSQKWNCYFQNRIIMFRLPVPTLIDLWEIYISRICLPILLRENMWTDPGNK